MPKRKPTPTPCPQRMYRRGWERLKTGSYEKRICGHLYEIHRARHDSGYPRWILYGCEFPAFLPAFFELSTAQYWAHLHALWNYDTIKDAP